MASAQSKDLQQIPLDLEATKEISSTESITTTPASTGPKRCKTRKGPELPARERLIRLPDVLRMTGLSRSSLYRMKKGDFPSSVALSKHTVAWVETEIFEWISERVSLARGLCDKQTRPKTRR